MYGITSGPHAPARTSVPALAGTAISTQLAARIHLETSLQQKEVLIVGIARNCMFSIVTGVRTSIFRHSYTVTSTPCSNNHFIASAAGRRIGELGFCAQPFTANTSARTRPTRFASDAISICAA